MSANTKIEWADHTFNPWVGCTKVSPACDNCYAEAWAKRAGRAAGVEWGGDRRRTSQSTWKWPLRWNAQAKREGRRFRVFCASLADVFDNQVPATWREDLFRTIASTPHLDWLLLTKRIGNARHMIAEATAAVEFGDSSITPWTTGSPWPNVWIGATVCNQAEADRDIPRLLAVPARVRFLSVEPMLGPINLKEIPIRGSGHHEFDPIIIANVLHTWVDRPRVDWVICGGESGPRARPMHPDWVSSLRDQCAGAGVPFLFKQWGEWIPMAGHAEGVSVRGEKFQHADGTVMGWAGKQAAGRLLNGIQHDGFPTGGAA